MEKKSLLQYFREAAGTEQRFAERIVKVLVANGIYTIDLLNGKSDAELYAIKGIGDFAINMIGRVKTKYQAELENREKEYKKQCKRCMPTTLSDWFRQLDMPLLHAKKLENTLRANGIKSIDDFMNTSQEELGSFKGIGPKYLQICFATKGLIENCGRRKKNKK